jgi:hypothetical protein
MNINSFITKDYGKNDAFAVQKNKANSKPNKANFKNGRQNAEGRKQKSESRVRSMLSKLLNFHLKNSLTGLCNSVKWIFLCNERECFYEELCGEKK